MQKKSYMNHKNILNEGILDFISKLIIKGKFKTASKIFKGDKEYRPFMKIRNIHENFIVNDVKIETFKHNHGSIDVQTYKIGKFAYSTDL